jgi:hypothetical protein
LKDPCAARQPPTAERPLHERVQPIETSRNIASEVHAQQAPAARREDLEVAARLRRLDDAERIPSPRHREIDDIVARDLQEDPAVGAAFVRLARRVQKPRPVADTGRDARVIAQISVVAHGAPRAAAASALV